MLIKSCFPCKDHEIRQEGSERWSYCVRENCWSRYSKCVLRRALETFFESETTSDKKPFSAIDHLYPVE